jgi:murein L,D-transpeptidase YcbB/YkuD
MEKFKFALFSVIVLAGVGFVWYWSISTIETGSEHVDADKLKQLEIENQDLQKKLADLSDQVEVLKLKEEPVSPIPVPVVKEEPKPTTPATYKNQSLINELQKLVDDKVSMKLKSIGTRVGTVQKFLNVYNNTSNKIDNDYGANMVKLVTAFQKAEGMKADGEAGVSTFKKMIEWLKK